MSQNKPAIRILALPHLDPDAEADESFRTLAHKYRQIRLDAFLVNPDAFASSYDTQVKIGIEPIIERFRNPLVTILIAVRETSETPTAEAEAVISDLDLLLHGEWVGMGGTMGPKNPDGSNPMTTSFSSSEPASKGTVKDDVEPPLQFLMIGIFVSPTARRSGLGLRLVRDSVRVAEIEGQRVGRDVLFELGVTVGNDDAQKTYLKAGFVINGEMKFMQQPRTKLGETEPYERSAVKMELFVKASP